MTRMKKCFNSTLIFTVTTSRSRLSKILIDRILANTKRFTDRLHYKGAKAVLFLTIGDQKKAETELDEAVTEARNRTTLNEYQRYRLADTLSLFGALKADNSMLTEALELTKSFWRRTIGRRAAAQISLDLSARPIAANRSGKKRVRSICRLSKRAHCQ
jgi:hypothetical protein